MPAPLFRDDLPIPEHLPGEPRRDRPPTPIFLVRIALRVLLVTALLLLLLPLWPLFWLGAAIQGRPPNVPRGAQVIRYLRLIWTVRPPPPGLPTLPRVWLTLEVLRKVAVTPFWGLCWLLDGLLYGRALRETRVVAPLIEISAARSGSTQLARYLEEDPALIAPMMLQIVFPYLWMWRLAPRTIGRVLTRERVSARVEAMLPREFLERHEGDLFRTDTFDGAIYISHLNNLAPFLGPDALIEDFGFGVIAPHNRTLWEVDFVNLLDGIARKCLLQAGPAPGGGPRRFFVKGHFLAAADALERRYPDARFLTMIREPGPRLQSAVNFLRANPVDATMGPVPWPWLGAALSETEAVYCEQELRWFTRAGGARRLVLRFNDYVRDLEGAMRTVYRECLDCAELPEQAPRQHPPRERTNYSLDRSLAQVGVDAAALDLRLAPYLAWCRGEKQRPTPASSKSRMFPG